MMRFSGILSSICLHDSFLCLVCLGLSIKTLLMKGHFDGSLGIGDNLLSTLISINIIDVQRISIKLYGRMLTESSHNQIISHTGDSLFVSNITLGFLFVLFRRSFDGALFLEISDLLGKIFAFTRLLKSNFLLGFLDTFSHVSITIIFFEFIGFVRLQKAIVLHDLSPAGFATMLSGKVNSISLTN